MSESSQSWEDTKEEPTLISSMTELTDTLKEFTDTLTSSTNLMEISEALKKGGQTGTGAR